MLLSMMILLSVTSCLLELMIAAKVPLWRKLSHKYPLFNLINSLFISFIIGVMFGANGLVAFGAGIISTLLSVPGYRYLYEIYDSPRAKAVGGNLYRHVVSKWKTALSDFFQIVYVCLKVITFPIWFPRYLYKKIFKFVKS